MEREEIQKRLKKELDKNRYEHTLGVMYTAGSLAMASRQRKRFLSVKKTIS